MFVFILLTCLCVIKHMEQGDFDVFVYLAKIHFIRRSWPLTIKTSLNIILISYQMVDLLCFWLRNEKKFKK